MDSILYTQSPITREQILPNCLKQAALYDKQFLVRTQYAHIERQIIYFISMFVNYTSHNIIRA